jgi:hypothetical protein
MYKCSVRCILRKTAYLAAFEIHVKWGLQWTGREQNESTKTVFSVDPQCQIEISPVSSYTNEKCEDINCPLRKTKTS